MPQQCAETWLKNNPEFLSNIEKGMDTSTPFPVMDKDDSEKDTVENWLGQPVLPWTYDSGSPRNVEGVFAMSIYFSK